ncbi:MAG: hypothetical protein H6851_15000 [Geminicoccaceae bacterium]|nr:hypothetical protein [Geminicoccaceae bacterium]
MMSQIPRITALAATASLALLVTSCGRQSADIDVVDYRPPSTAPGLPARETVQGSEAAAIQGAASDIERLGFHVESVDLENGLLTADYLGDAERYVDCGSMRLGNEGVYLPASSPRMNLNAFPDQPSWLALRQMRLDARLVARTRTVGYDTQLNATAVYVLTRTVDTLGNDGAVLGTVRETISFETGGVGRFDNGTTCHPTGELERTVANAMVTAATQGVPNYGSSPGSLATGPVSSTPSTTVADGYPTALAASQPLDARSAGVAGPVAPPAPYPAAPHPGGISQSELPAPDAAETATSAKTVAVPPQTLDNYAITEPSSSAEAVMAAGAAGTAAAAGAAAIAADSAGGSDEATPSPVDTTGPDSAGMIQAEPDPSTLEPPTRATSQNIGESPQSYLAAQPCADATVTTLANGDLQLAGYIAGNAEREQILQGLAERAGSVAVKDDTRLLPPGSCEALSFINEVHDSEIDGFAIALKDPQEVVREGTEIQLVVTLPGASRYFYVAYIEQDGKVHHLGPKYIDNTGIGDRFLYRTGQVVKAPAGVEMIVAIASREKPFADGRPPVEEADTFFAELRARYGNDPQGASAVKLILDTQPR